MGGIDSGKYVSVLIYVGGMYNDPIYGNTECLFYFGRVATSLSPRALMLCSNSWAFLAFQFAPFLPGTASFPKKPMYMTSFAPWPAFPDRRSLGKHSFASEMEASPVVGSMLVSPQTPYHYQSGQQKGYKSLECGQGRRSGMKTIHYW